MRIFIFTLLAISVYALSASSLAGVSISGSYYNSNSAFNEDLTLTNSNYRYSAVTILFPDEIISKGSGMGKGSGSFSHGMSFVEGNDRSNIRASIGADSDSLVFSWSKVLDGELNGKQNAESQEFSIKANYMLDDGKVNTHFQNDQSEIKGALTTFGAHFENKAAVQNDFVSSEGSGKSLEDSEIYTLIQSTSINDGTKWYQIETFQEGKEIDYGWGTIAQIPSVSDDPLIGMKLATSSENGQASVDMIGSASMFPTQYLPPGKLEVEEYKIPKENGDEPGDGDISPGGTGEIPVIDVNLPYVNTEWWINDAIPTGPKPNTGGGGNVEDPKGPIIPEPTRYPLEAIGKFDYFLKMGLKI